jgi:hypothetical protein
MDVLHKMEANDWIARREISEGSGEKACWVALLKRLRIAQGDMKKAFDVAAVQKVQREGGAQTRHLSGTPVVVCMRILRRSRDFMVMDSVTDIS